MVKYLTDELKQEIYNTYIDLRSRLSAGDLARKYQTCDKTIYRIIKQYGGNPHKKNINQIKQKIIQRQNFKQTHQMSEITNKFVSSEQLGRKGSKTYTSPYSGTPMGDALVPINNGEQIEKIGRKGSKTSPEILEIAKQSMQTLVDSGEVSENHYPAITPSNRKTSKEPPRQGSKRMEELPLFDLDKIYDAKNGKFIK